MIGTTIEWYDFFLYGIAAALIFNKIYFPAIDPITGTLAAFGTYAVGFVARPLGGIVFGHFGDRVGRKSMLMISLMLMGVPTVLIGLTPSYESIGYWGAVAWCSVVSCKAWRSAASGAGGADGGGARAGRQEGAVRQPAASRRRARPDPVVAGDGRGVPAARGGHAQLGLAPAVPGQRVPAAGGLVHPRQGRRIARVPGRAGPAQARGAAAAPCCAITAPVLAALVACISEKTWFYTIATFSLTYAVGTLGLPRETILNGVIWARPPRWSPFLFGWLGDRCSKQAIFIAGALGISLFSAGFFALLDEKTAYHTNVAMLVAFGVVYAAMYAQESSLFASMFPPEVRYTGISLAVQIGGAIGGGTAPLVATYLLAQGGGSPRLIVFYLAGWAWWRRCAG